jgi:autotransporter-associated beta strand protein
MDVVVNRDPIRTLPPCSCACEPIEARLAVCQTRERFCVDVADEFVNEINTASPCTAWLRAQETQKMKKNSTLVLATATLAVASIASAQNTLISYGTTGGTNFVAPAAPNLWTGGNPGAGSSTLDVRFRWMPGGLGHSINNDTGAAFTANVIRLQSNVSSTSPSLGTSGAGSPSFTFDGTSPKLIQEGMGVNVGFSPTTLSSATTELGVSGTGLGDFGFNGLQTANNIRIALTPGTGYHNTQVFNYGPSTAGAAPVIIDSGNVRFGPTGSLGLVGIPSIAVNGGTFVVFTGTSTTYGGTGTVRMSVPITVAGGANLVQTGGSSTASTAITSLPFNSISHGQNLGYTAAITGQGGYKLAPTAGGSLTSFVAGQTYQGATTVEFGRVYGGLTSSGAANSKAGVVDFFNVLAVDGINGSTNASITATSALNIRDGGVFALLNGNNASTNRVNDSADLNLDGGHLYVTTGTAGYAETMSKLVALSGTGTITVGNAGTTATINNPNVTVSFSQLTRNAGDGMLYIRGGASGANAATNGLGTSATTPRVLFSSAPTTALYAGAPNIAGGATPSVAVIPFVVGGAIASEAGATATNSSSTTFGLTTYGGNGVRVLQTSEYDNVTGAGTTITLGTSFGNLRLNQSAATTHNIAAGGTTVNSLFINPGSGALTLGAAGGTDSLNFPSDAANLIVVNQSQGTIINAPISFGAEGKIYAANNSSNTSGPTINGVIAGTSGLTIGGQGGVNLTAANTVSGNLTIAGARLGLNNSNNLQNITTITVGGGAAVNTTSAPTPTSLRPRLQFNSPASGSVLDLPQNVELRSGLLEVINNQLSSSSTTSINLKGAISGSGGLFINTGTGSIANSVVRLSNPNNSYSGQTRVWTGTLAFNSDRALGNSSSIDLSSGGSGLLLEGNWISSKQINMSSGGTINTNGFNATLAGTITSWGAGASDTLFKTGAGRLNLTGNSTLNMNVTASAGSLAINGVVGPGGTITAASGARIEGAGTSLKSLAINGGGTLAPGNSIGNLTVGGSVNFSNLGVHEVEIQSGPLASDLLTMVGGGTFLTLGSGSSTSGTATSTAILNIVDLTGGYQFGDVLWIVNNQGPVSPSNFAAVSLGVYKTASGTLLFDDSITNTIPLYGSTFLQVSYNADFDTLNGRFTDSTTPGNDIALRVIPEPTTLAMVGAGAVVVLRRRKGR